LTLPTYVASQTGYSTGNSTTRTITLPTNVADDYIFVAMIDDAGQQTFTIPSGWTRLYDTLDVHNTTSATFLTIYKKSGGNEGSSIVVTTSKSERAVWIAFTIRGVHQSSPIHVSGTTGTGSSTSASIPTLTTSSTDMLVIGIVGTDTFTTPHDSTSSYTRLEQLGYTSAGSVSLWYQNKATAGAVSAATVTINASEQWIGASFALAPLPGGAVLSTPAVAQVYFTLSPRPTSFTLSPRGAS
jgi:hypothetical protein